MVNAPFPWMGGKSRLRAEIVRRVREAGGRCYVETCGGAASVLLGMEPMPVEVYNDINGELVNFFRVVKSQHKAFVQAFEWLLVSRKSFYEFRAQDTETLGEIERAVRFFYIIKSCFGGKWSGATFGYSRTSKPGLNLENLYETITAVHKRLRRVYIEEGTAREVVRRYDGADTVFFVDPPYFGTTGYGKGRGIDYGELRTTLGSVKGKFLLTINDCAEMREMWRGFRIEEVEVPYSVGRSVKSRRRFGELIVRNY